VIRATLAVALLVCAGPSGIRADEAACGDCRYAGDIMAVFVSPEVLGKDWEIVHETAGDVLGDPDMRRAGVRATQALHYTQAIPGGSRVCSIEIWRFTGAEAARRAAVGNERDNWRIKVLGNLWVMLHGVVMQRGEPMSQKILPECHRLADLTEGRALALLTRKIAR
jgi:hypothetical protein